MKILVVVVAVSITLIMGTTFFLGSGTNAIHTSKDEVIHTSKDEVIHTSKDEVIKYLSQFKANKRVEIIEERGAGNRKYRASLLIDEKIVHNAGAFGKSTQTDSGIVAFIAYDDGKVPFVYADAVHDMKDGSLDCSYGQLWIKKEGEHAVKVDFGNVHIVNPVISSNGAFVACIMYRIAENGMTMEPSLAVIDVAKKRLKWQKKLKHSTRHHPLKWINDFQFTVLELIGHDGGQKKIRLITI